MSREQLLEIRSLVEQNGYLPYSNKALRLFTSLESLPGANPTSLNDLKAQFQDAGYLPFSRAMELIKLVGTRVS